jgi:hypothetical protein
LRIICPGTAFVVNAWRNDALEVPVKYYGSHRFWRHTTIAKLAAEHKLSDGATPSETGGSASQQAGGASGTTSNGGASGTAQQQQGVLPEKVTLVKGLLGHEWDEDMDNGYRPAGLMHLSSTTVDNVQYLMDEGATFDTATATHHLTMYRRYSHPDQVSGEGGAANTRVTEPRASEMSEEGAAAAGGDADADQCGAEDADDAALASARSTLRALSNKIRTYLHDLKSSRPRRRGGLVFGAGTCQWSWGLDGHHDLVNGLDLQMGKVQWWWKE